MNSLRMRRLLRPSLLTTLNEIIKLHHISEKTKKQKQNKTKKGNFAERLSGLVLLVVAFLRSLLLRGLFTGKTVPSLKMGDTSTVALKL